jgi:hypothetical protein
MNFYLERDEDVSGVSGIGIVATGVVFPDGQCVLQWKNTGSIAIYRDLDTLIEVHGHSGATRIVPVGRPG